MPAALSTGPQNSRGAHVTASSLVVPVIVNAIQDRCTDEKEHDLDVYLASVHC
jgi:hypothetical protein